MGMLPALGFNPQNALINFAPVNEAINTNRRNALMQQESDRQDEELGLRKQQFAQQQKMGALDYGAKLAQHSAGLAQMALAEKDPARKQAIMTRMYSLDPSYRDNLASHGVNPDDHDTAANFVIAEARGYQDPLDTKAKQLQIQNAQNQVGMNDLDRRYKEAQIKALNEKADDPVAKYLMERLQPKPAAPAAPQQPTLQPQSFQGQAPGNGLILTGNETATPADSQPDNKTGPDDAMIETPYGTMPRGEAKRLGGTMLLSPKYSAAGKAMLDSVNALSSSDLAKAAGNENDKAEIAATNSIATLDNIKKTYDAKFLNIPNRFSLWGKGLAAKFGTLNPKDQKDLQDYAAFRQSSWHNLNRILKDLSGTAVTENEMQRQLLDQPNPGQGITDGDGPQEFEAKLKGQIAFAHSAVARSRYLRSKGFTGKPWEAGVAVEDMPNIINQRGQELEQQLRQANPKANPMQLQEAVKTRIKQEFGI